MARDECMARERRITPDRGWPASNGFSERLERFVGACNAGRIDEALSFFAPDAVLIPADQPGVRGHAAIRENLMKAFRERITFVSLTMHQFVATGEIAVQRGNYERRMPSDRGDVISQHGPCEVFWRRQEDGQFRLTSLRFGQPGPKAP